MGGIVWLQKICFFRTFQILDDEFLGSKHLNVQGCCKGASFFRQKFLGIAWIKSSPSFGRCLTYQLKFLNLGVLKGAKELGVAKIPL